MNKLTRDERRDVQWQSRVYLCQSRFSKFLLELGAFFPARFTASQEFSVSIPLVIIGGGVMGEAILAGLLRQQLYPPDAILVREISPERQEYLQRQYQVRAIAGTEGLFPAETVLLAVKPQGLEPVAASLVPHFQGNPPLLLSILAGVTLQRLEAAFPQAPVIRAMPNTPATVGAAITAIAGGNLVKEAQLEAARRLFEAIGQVVEVPEFLMDAVTGLSGSGPAYVALAIEALADGGVAAGLARGTALQLALQTVLGTAQLLQSTGLHPAVLKDRVSSPGGTTIAGVAALERAGFRSALIEAVLAAQRRSQELGQS
ncbi:MAG: pyrroline-5-carboxylate reductase [Chloroflexaceae bacterium]|nr:pyrroline-5-carboxylate reductase [Chloroflexaceae bacterium]